MGCSFIAHRSLSLQYRYQKSRRMSDTEDVPVKSPAAKAAAKKSAAKAVQGLTSSHPKYADMVASTIEAIASRGGCSRQAILKKIKEDFDVGDNERRVAINVNMTLKKGVESGKLKMARRREREQVVTSWGRSQNQRRKNPSNVFLTKLLIRKLRRKQKRRRLCPRKR